MGGGRSTFQFAWLKVPKYSTWLEQVTNDHTLAHCRLCNKSFKIKGHGESGLKSHAQGKKHEQLEKAACSQSTLFINKISATASATVSATASMTSNDAHQSPVASTNAGKPSSSSYMVMKQYQQNKQDTMDAKI